MNKNLRAIATICHILLMAILCGAVIETIEDQIGYFLALMFVIALLLWTIFKLWELLESLEKEKVMRGRE